MFIKDNVDKDDMCKTTGSEAMVNCTLSIHVTLVKDLRAVEAIILGKCNPHL